GATYQTCASTSTGDSSIVAATATRAMRRSGCRVNGSPGFSDRALAHGCQDFGRFRELDDRVAAHNGQRCRTDAAIQLDDRLAVDLDTRTRHEDAAGDLPGLVQLHAGSAPVGEPLVVESRGPSAREGPDVAAARARDFERAVERRSFVGFDGTIGHAHA